ncbi:MAG: UDP-glucose 4-epimerase GalE [Paracoccaceae bacterium]
MGESGRILVTGGAGFIGAHACKALAKAGHAPITYDNLSTGHADAVKWGPLLQGDVRDRESLTTALRQFRITTVMHFAASAYVGESVANPGLYYDNNVGGMNALLDACVAAGVGRVVLSSSCATYGLPASQPITEETPQRPINPYGRTKLICEEMLADYATAHGLRFAALRYFNAAGADSAGEIGERHEPETHLLPLALRAAAEGARLTVFGTDYDTPDGTCIRDYIHVGDLARAHAMALAYLEDGGDTVALNLGTGRGHSILEVAEAIHRVTGRAVPMSFGPRRAGDPPRLVADPSRAASVLGFRAELSDMDRIVADAAPWFGHRPRQEQVA